MAYPLLTIGQVQSHDPDNHSVFVLLKTGESPVLPVRVGTHGPADALRVVHAELPGRGTWGLLAFPHGDARNGVWLAAYPANCLDAFTAAPTDTAVRYAAHLSGHWEMLGQDGSTTQTWPDGSQELVGPGTAGGLPVAPQTFRHVLDRTGARVRAPLTQAERVPSPPAAFGRVFAHPSGATVSISNVGVVSELSATGQLINVGAVGDMLLRLIDERMVAAFNTHVHAGTNEPPTVQLEVPNVATTHLHGG